MDTFSKKMLKRKGGGSFVPEAAAQSLTVHLPPSSPFPPRRRHATTASSIRRWSVLLLVLVAGGCVCNIIVFVHRHHQYQQQQRQQTEQQLSQAHPPPPPNLSRHLEVGKRSVIQRTVGVEDEGDYDQQYDYTNGAPLVFGTYQRMVQNTTEVVYALPPLSSNSSSSSSPFISGIALLLHACTHSAMKFFSPSSQTCPMCIGLSEEVTITRQLLHHYRFAVLAVSSTDRKSGCWNLAKTGDISRVHHALEEFQELLLLLQKDYNYYYEKMGVVDISTKTTTSLPIIAIGASSGGRFAAALVDAGIATDGALVMVSGIGTTTAQQWSRTRLLPSSSSGSGSGASPRPRPPPLYLAPMPRDAGTTKRVRHDYETMLKEVNNNGLTTTNATTPPPPPWVVLDVSTCVPLDVSVNYLNHRVPHMTRIMAQQIIDALVQANHLTPSPQSTSTTDHTPQQQQQKPQENDIMYRLVQDPTRSDWRDILQHACANQGCLYHQPLTPGFSPLAKALHRSWAFHEYCSEVIPLAMKYFTDYRRQYPPHHHAVLSSSTA